MYYLIDLSNQTRKSFETKIGLLAHWRFCLWGKPCAVPPPLEARDFKHLNITGKDKYNPLFESTWMRRFQVVDDEGRSQDIRTWEKEIEIVNSMDSFPRRYPAAPQPRFRREPAGMGAKLPLRKGRYGAFTRQRLRDLRGTPQIDCEDDLLGFTPVRDKTRPRLQRSLCWGKEGERKSRSWKSQTKNTSQWGRHAERAAEIPIRKRIFEELDVEQLTAELVGV